MPKKHPQVDEYLDSLEPSTRALSARLRKEIFAAAQGVEEEFKWSRPVYAAEAPFCSFKVAKAHISLSFNQGATLDDPAGLLEGTGKAMRHVKIGLEETLISEDVVDLLRRAASAEG